MARITINTASLSTHKRKGNSFLSVLRYYARNPLILLTGFLYIQASFAKLISPINLKRTLGNIEHHLGNNSGAIEWEVNQSGFVRYRFPSNMTSWLVNYDCTEFEGDAKEFKLRTHIWWHPDEVGEQELVDKAAHDHPKPFTTFIINGGYTHKMFKEERQSVDFTFYKQCLPCFPDFTHSCVDKSVISKANGQVSNEGISRLKEVDLQEVGQGSVVKIGDNTIHQVVKYKPNTVTLNFVKNKGKNYFRIFVPDITAREVNASIKREKIRGDKAKNLTQQVIRFYRNAKEKAIDDCEKRPSALFK